MLYCGQPISLPFPLHSPSLPALIFPILYPFTPIELFWFPGFYVYPKLDTHSYKMGARLSIEERTCISGPVLLIQYNASQNGYITGNIYWHGYVERWTLEHWWWGCKLVQLLCKVAWRLLKTLETKLSCGPAIPPLGMFLKETISYHRDTCTMFIAALFMIAKKADYLRSR